ncbi:pilus assembly protein PilO [Pelomonas sp. Root1444]|nr:MULTISPECIES: type 4a pilus biogenesis protein PilO [Roseateles]KQY89044.1 pilus assembly protein PilO [Pelomonas sp. Root1444]
MATSMRKIDLNAWFQDLVGQFQGLNPKEPGQWPMAPKLAASFGVMLLVVIVGYFVLLADEQAALEAEQNREPQLRQDYRAKLAQAVNLPELRRQKSQVEEYVTQLEKQLPGKAEIDSLLSDISSAGVGRGLQFELFRPGQVLVKDYYAELPIALRVSGRYHDIGAFAADVSNLSRIVTLHNLVVQAPTGRDASTALSMEATARTYRYLDSTEVAEQRKAAAAAKAGGKK